MNNYEGGSVPNKSRFGPSVEAEIRAGYYPGEFNLNVTDGMGLLDHSNKESKDYLTSYLKEVLKASMELEKGAFNKLDKTESYTPEKDELYRLQQLVNFMSHITYLPPEESDRTFVTNRYRRSLEVERVIQPYSVNGVAPKNIYPDYDYKNPALVQLKIHDQGNGQTLIFEYFPQQFTDYGRYVRLNGSDITDAAEDLGRQRIPSEERESVLTMAKQTQKKPYFRISLEGPTREPIAAISGDYIESSGKKGFVLSPEQMNHANQSQGANYPFGEIRTFLPLRGKLKPGELPMERLARAMLGLEIKPPFKAKAPAARVA